MAKKAEIWLVYSTFPSHKEALAASRTLLNKRLVACANLYDSVTSLYRWQGKLVQEKETALVAKTQKSKLAAAVKCLRKIHSYDVPCVVAYRIKEGNPAFLQWVADETA